MRQEQSVYKYPQTMGAYNALMENVDFINEDTLTLAIEISKDRGDSALTRKDVEKAIAKIKEQMKCNV